MVLVSAYLIRKADQQQDVSSSVELGQLQSTETRESSEGTKDSTTQTPAQDGDRPPSPSRPCFSVADFDATFDVRAEEERLRFLFPSGDVFDDYRGIEMTAMRSLAAQNDKTAMLLLAVQTELQALGVDPMLAVERFSRPESPIGLADIIKHASPPAESREQLERARDLYYAAALAGNLAAMTHLGYVQVALGETPVTLGWIQQDEFEALPREAKYPVEVINAYTLSMREISPSADSGAASILFELAAPALRNKAYPAVIAEQFKRDRTRASLPPVEILSSKFSTDEIREFWQNMCPADRQLIETR